MKKWMASLFAALLMAGSIGLVSCDTAAEEAVEEKGEMIEERGEAMEEKGDELDNEAMEEKGEAMEDLGDDLDDGEAD